LQMRLFIVSNEYDMTKRRAKKIPGVALHHGSGVMAKKLTGSGVVKHYVQGSMKLITDVGFNPGDLIEVVQIGLPVTELTDLRACLDVPVERLAPMLGISKATSTGARVRAAN